MDVTQQISNLIQRQYPQFYQQNGNNFIQFITAYYSWLEEEGNALYYSRNYYNIKEIDKTFEQFLVHFKQKYFHNIQLGTNADIRLLLKHATDIYRAKGSQRAVELLFQLAFGEAVEFYYPSRDLFRLSDGVWFKPQYLELSLADNNVDLNQKEVFGVTSGAIAFVDAVVRRFTVGQLQDVAYISAINGTFIAGEAIQPTDMSIDITQCPILKGSLQSIFFPSVGTGTNYTIGDTIPVSSRNGNNALFLVTNTTSESIVTLFFNDGGYGYTTTPNLYLSTVNLTLANVTITNTEPLFNNAWNFLDTLTQPLASINYQNANALFSYGDTIVTYDGGGNITSVGFTIGINEIDANTGQMTIAVNSGNVGSNQQIWTIGNTKTANLTVANGYMDITATGQYIANSANVAMVLSNLSKPFVVGEEVVQYNPERNIVWGSGIVQTYDTSRAILSILMQRGILYPNNQIDGIVSMATANVVSITARVGLINVNNTFIASNIAFVSSNNMSANVNVVDVVQGNVGIGIVNTLNYPETILLGTDQIGPYLTVPIGQNRYNFPGFIAGNLSFGTIGDMLSYANLTIGKIPNIVFLGSSLTSLTEPFVVVDQPEIRDRQFFDNILSYTGSTGSFPIGEIIQQGTTNARGMLRTGSNDSIMILERMRYSNDFIVTMNSSTQLNGLLTGFVANCTNVAIDYDSQVMGHNAVIDLTYAVGSGIITEGKVVDSGYGFQQGETIQIGANLAQGIAVVNNYGTGSGYYANVGSFPSGQKRLFDGVYWQNFSYEIQSSLMLSKYQDLMDELTHVAGTQLFGRYIFKASDLGEIDVVGQFKTGNQYGTNATFIVDTQALLTTQNVHSIIRLSNVTTTFQKRPLQVLWSRLFRGIANFYPAKAITPARTNLMFTANAAPVTFGHGNRFTKAAVTFTANTKFLQAHGSATFRSFQPQITVTSQFNKSRIPVRTLGIYRVTANLKFGTVFRAITRTLQFQATATGQSIKIVNPLGFRTFGVTATNPRQPVVPGKNTNSVVSTKATPTPRAMTAGRAFTANATFSRILSKNGGAPYSYSFVMNAAANALSKKTVVPTHINLSAITLAAQRQSTIQPIRNTKANATLTEIRQIQPVRTGNVLATVPQVKKAVTPTGFRVSTATALAIVNKQVNQAPKSGLVEALVYGSSWTPANLTNIVAFYRADQGVSLNPGTNNVVQVLDLSGHGEFLVNTFANCPQLTTVSPFKQPVIAINPGNNSALLQNQLFDSFGANTIGSFWIVTANGVGAINATSTATVMAFLATTGLTGTNSMYLLQGNTAAAGNTVVGAFLENLGAGGEVGGGTAGFGNNIPMASITITGLTIDGTTARVWQNGQVVANSAYSNAIGNTSGVTGFYIGDSTAGIVWQGAFASAGVCKGYAMNANDWANMIAWTNSVWGSNIPLANGSPVGLSKQVQTNRAFTANETFGLLKQINQKRTHQVVAVPLGAGGGNWQHTNAAANTIFDLGFNIPTWSHIQGKTDTSGSGTSKSISFASPIANGSIVVGAVLLGPDLQVTSITDDQSTPYVLINEVGLPAAAGGLLTVTGFRSNGAITSAAQTLTFHYQGPSTPVWIMMDEFNPGISIAGGIFTDGTQLMNGGTQGFTPKFQTLKQNDLLYSASFCTSTIANGSGWTAAQGSGTQQMAEWKQVIASSNTANATFTFTPGANWNSTFGISISPPASWVLRQNQIQRTANNVSNGSITFTNPVANGSIVIGSIAVGTVGGGDADISHIIGIQDDKGNEYALIANTATIGRCVFWSNGVITNSPTTITAKCNQSEVVIYFLVNEFIPPPGTLTFGIDGSAGNAPTGSSPLSSNTITTTQGGDLIYSFSDNIGANASPLNGFSTLNGQYMTWCDAYLIQQTAGSVACAWDAAGGAGSDATAIVAFSANNNPLTGRFSIGASVLGANAVGHGI